MKSFFAIIFSDWRRKLVAVAIALALWSWIEGRIAYDDDVILKIGFTTEDIGTPDDFQLLIQAPPGWVLTEPAIGDQIKVVIHGSKSQVQSFKSQQCAANYVANFIPDEDSILQTVKVLPEQLNWMRPGDAKLLLDNISDGQQELQKLVFERVKTATVALTSSEIMVDGSPAEAHVVRTEQLQFSPNTVTVTGPQASLDNLLIEVSEAHSSKGQLNNSELLNILKIPDGTRNDVSQTLGLHPRWLRRGIRMEPTEVTVKAMVRLKAPFSSAFNPNREDLLVIPPEDPAAANLWELGDWEGETWSVTLPHVENDHLISDAWIQEHVRLFVSLRSFTTEGTLTSRKVRIEAHIVGIEDPADQSFFEQHLVIGPVQGSDNDMITVKRKQ
jgi:hypothetical protein